MSASPATNPRPINIVGAGIVGLSVAWSLVSRGRPVRVFDSQAPGSGTSFGNSGSLSSGSVVPLATPGAGWSGAKMLLDSRGPLVVRKRYWLQAMPWLWRFARVSDEATVNRIAGHLLEILSPTLTTWQRVLTEIGATDLYQPSGQLHVYPSEAAMLADGFAWGLRERLGVHTERLDRAALQARQPGIAPHYAAGVFLPDAATITDPHGLCLRLAAALRARGVEFVTTEVRAIAADGEVDDGDRRWPGERCVLAAGAWSMRLARALGVRLPLESQRGYHVQRRQHEVAPGIRLNGPVVAADSKVFIVPMDEGVRVGGTVEFAGLRALPAPRRFALLRESFSRVFPEAPAAAPADEREWMGHRPCLPDTMPVLGPLPGLPAVWAAFGHGHLGLTMSAVTGEWIARALCGDPPRALDGFAADRPTLRHTPIPEETR